MNKKGFFITFEGTDGAGKSTQIRLAAEWLSSLGYPVLTTREPGGGAVSERIRNLLLDPALQMEALTELFLYQAARVEHVQKVLKPALAEGKIVVCDRFTDATLAYQGHARGLGKTAPILNKLATGGLTPHLTLLLNVPPDQGLERARKAKTVPDRLENEGLEFQKSVQKGYLQLAKKEPRRIKLVNVQLTVEATQNIIRQIINRGLRGNSGPTPSTSLLNARV